MPGKTPEEQIGVSISPDDTEYELEDAVGAGDEADLESERPDFLDSRYSSVEDQARAWRDSQELIARQGNELGQLRRQFEQMQADQSRPFGEETQYDQDEVVSTWDERFAESPTLASAQLFQQMLDEREARRQQELAPIQQRQQAEQAQLLAASVDQTMTQRYGEEWSFERKQAVGQKLVDSGLIHTPQASSFEGLVGLLEQANQWVKAEETASAYQQAGVSQADAERAAKIQAQTLRGGGGAPPEPSEADRQLAAMKAARAGTAASVLSNSGL